MTLREALEREVATRRAKEWYADVYRKEGVDLMRDMKEVAVELFNDPDFQRLEDAHDAARIDAFLALLEAGVRYPYATKFAEMVDGDGGRL